MGVPPGKERRQTPRMPTRLPIAMQWRTEGNDMCRARGTTRDLSQGGVYCFLEDPLPVGLPVEFDVIFPAELTAGEPLRLHCQGRILRSETSGRRFGVAAHIETHQVLESGEVASETDRRAYTRVLPRAAIIVDYPGVRSMIRDLSLTGAFVEDERPFPVGRQMELHLHSDGPGSEVKVKAIVRRVEPQIGMAVEFVAISQENHERLRALVEAGGLRPV